MIPRAATLRVFAVATPNGYVVMPGGLTRVSAHENDIVSMQSGGASKDTWVLAGHPVNRTPLRRPRLGVQDVAKSAVDIASRVGENLFWTGRYAERSEGLARLLRAALERVVDATQHSSPTLNSLFEACDRLGVLPMADLDEKGKEKTPRDRTAGFVSGTVVKFHV